MDGKAEPFHKECGEAAVDGKAEPFRKGCGEAAVDGKAEPFRKECVEAAVVAPDPSGDSNQKSESETRHNANKFFMSYGCNVDPVSCHSTHL